MAHNTRWSNSEKKGDTTKPESTLANSHKSSYKKSSQKHKFYFGVYKGILEIFLLKTNYIAGDQYFQSMHLNPLCLADEPINGL